MHIDWAAFGEVFVVSFGVAVGIIALFAIGVGLLSVPTPALDGPHQGVAVDDDVSATRSTPPGARPTVARRVTAWMCFLACGFSVAYGLCLIIMR